MDDGKHDGGSGGSTSTGTGTACSGGCLCLCRRHHRDSCCDNDIYDEREEVEEEIKKNQEKTKDEAAGNVVVFVGCGTEF